jgi:hypothetical protein
MPVECAHAVSVRITRPNEFLAFALLKHVVRVWAYRSGYVCALLCADVRGAKDRMG